MAVAFDAVSNVAAGSGDLSWTHTPVGTPRAALVFIVTTGSLSSDVIDGVTYGATAMTEVSGSPNVHSTGETGSVYAYFLGASVPAGAQTVAVDKAAGNNASTRAVAVTLTAGGDVEVIDSDGTINSTSLANPSVVLSLGGRTCFAMIAFHSGQNDPTGITPLTNWTSRLEHDFGSQTGGWYTYDTISTVDVTAGWTQTAEDATAIAVAVSEIVPPNRRGQVGWAELEVIDPVRRGQIAFAELETPNAPAVNDRRGRVFFLELEAPTGDRRGQIGFGELQAPDVSHRGQISFAELEVESFDRRAHISFAELETPLLTATADTRTYGIWQGAIVTPPISR